jgi:hypothetical protein
LILIGIGIGAMVGVLCTSGLMVSVCTNPDPDLPCDLSTGGLLLLLLIAVGMFVCGSVGAIITFSRRSAAPQIDGPHDHEQERA